MPIKQNVTPIAVFECDRSGCHATLPMFVGSTVQQKTTVRHAGWHVADIQLYKDGVRTDETITKVLCPRHARERGVCPHYPEKHLVWQAQDGPVAICQMDNGHLENALRFIADRNKNDQGARKKLEEQIRARAPFYQQMYLEKARREGTNVVSGGAVPAPTGPHTPVVRTMVGTLVDQPLKMQTYDLVKELQPGEHVVVSRKADKGMVLNIDEDTVRALYHVLQNVGGFPDSPRRFTQDLVDAIAGAIPQSEWLTPWAAFPGGDAVEGSIHFLNDKQLAEKRPVEQLKAARRTGPIFGPGAAPSMSEPDGAGPSFYEDWL